jgi:hypothetical protein
MYLMINGNKHSVSRRIVTKDEIRYLTVSPEHVEITGIIRMYEDGGFLISEDNASDFERHSYSGTLLIMTNKPVPIPEPVQPKEDVWHDMAEAIKEGVNEV